jgi:hypothetical protein
LACRWTVGRVLGGRVDVTSEPGQLAFPGEMAVAMAVQATPRQSATRYSVRVGEAVEASTVKLHWDLSGLRKLLWAAARLRRGGCRSHLLSGEDLTPPIGYGGGHPSTTTEALAGRDTTIHWLSRHAAQQLWAPLAALPLPPARSLPAKVSSTTTHSRDRANLGTVTTFTERRAASK